MSEKKTVQDLHFEPKPSQLELGEPKEGKHDDKEHSGGNTYAGGVSASDYVPCLVHKVLTDRWSGYRGHGR